MRLLIACLHHPVSSGRWLYNALARLGHDVRHVGGYLKDEDKVGRHAWHTLGDWDHAWADWMPDAVIYADTVWPRWRHATYSAKPHAHVCTCNNVVNMRGGNWDRHFLAARYSAVWPVERDDEEWMPCGFSPRWHTPSPIPYEKRKYDVALIGRQDIDRSRYLDKLEAAGLKVFRAHGLYYQEYVDAYHNARISLCTNDQKSGMMRYFESAAMGNLIIGDVPESLEDLDGAQHMVRVSGLAGEEAEAELVEQAVRYATSPELAKPLIAGAYYWAQHQRWEDRAQQIVDWAERMM